MIRPFAAVLLAHLGQAIGIDIDNDQRSVADAMEFGEIAAEHAQLFDESSNLKLAQDDESSWETDYGSEDDDSDGDYMLAQADRRNKTCKQTAKQ